MTTTATVDAAAIDGAPFSRSQKRIVLLCALVAMLDGFDTQAIAFVAPVVAAAWGLPVSAFGAVFGAGLAGLMVGALAFGPAADRYGRRRVIIATTALFGSLTLLTALAQSLPMLLVLRFLTGLGLGGAMPNIIALTAECAPARLRATTVSIMFCGFPLGAVLGGMLAAKMIPAFGWESTFWLGGALPLLLLPALIAWLPESKRFLAERDGGKVTVAKLFGAGRTSVTLLLWLVFFMNLLLLYFLVNWLPSLLRQAGVPLDKAILSTALLNLGGIVGAITFARLIDGAGAYRVLPAAYSAAALATVAIGHATNAGFATLMALVFVAGFCVIGAQISINALAANLYATEVRATGVGWALGIGRAGSIVGPVVGGFLVATGLALGPLFTIAAAPAAVAALAVVLLSSRRAAPGPALPAAGLQGATK
jgi:AAHS family 4-hydroxybenzoate transporter-like MFS transporter